MPKAKEITTPAAAPEPVPWWVTNTPSETEYNLTMYENGGSIDGQNIDLTRDEFIELKAHLAKMRGLVPATQQPDAA